MVKKVTYDKLQVILEFLFFVRNKIIITIHLLDETASLFFEFLNKNSPQKGTAQKEIIEEKNDINNDFFNDNDSDDDIEFNMEEIKMELNYDNSKTNLEKNEKVFKSISIKPNEQIKCKILSFKLELYLWRKYKKYDV